MKMIIEPYVWHKTHIQKINRLNADTIVIRIERPEGYAFSAGQYAITRTYPSPQKFLVRQYSFSSPPSAKWLEFTVQKEPGGEVSTWLFEHAALGDMMEISQSYGHFVFEETSRPMLFIAGRVGLAPFMSYLREAPRSDIHILYSVEKPEQICYWEEIKHITTSVTTAIQPRIDQEMLASHIVDHPIVYICGSRQFSEAMQAHLSQLGVPPSDIKRELFTL